MEAARARGKGLWKEGVFWRGGGLWRPVESVIPILNMFKTQSGCGKGFRRRSLWGVIEEGGIWRPLELGGGGLWRGRSFER
jgi:hypothetical protein